MSQRQQPRVLPPVERLERLGLVGLEFGLPLGVGLLIDAHDVDKVEHPCVLACRAPCHTRMSLDVSPQVYVPPRILDDSSLITMPERPTLSTKSASGKCREALCVLEDRREQVALIGDSLHHRSDREAVWSKLRVVELVPLDRR